MVIDLSQWFGLQSRTVAVPLGGMVLLGDVLESVADTRTQVWKQPVFDLSSATTLGDDAMVRVGLTKPSH
ncbi:MAG: hypothetical protein EON55_17735 [Alphaproteobacteria bacterium]|nr:MAG: hypothetical protein EON55_17735 [Alphaproteobacteria bacterium]